MSDIDQLVFTAAPGYSYRLSISSSGIDESLPSNVAFMKAKNKTLIDYNFFVNLRTCIMGEYFTSNGKCIYCEAGVGYSVVVMTEPGSCKECPTERAYCEGGANVGPKPGYWRVSNMSSDFLKCPYPAACLGFYPINYETYEPMG